MPPPALTVWYNTRCPVCDAGIGRQRNKLIAAVEAGAIAFRDINLEPDALAAHGAGLEDIRRRLYATDAQGRLLVGADVALAVWRLTPGEGWLAALLGNPMRVPSRASPTTVSPTCSTPGTGARGIGEAGWIERPGRLRMPRRRCREPIDMRHGSGGGFRGMSFARFHARLGRSTHPTPPPSSARRGSAW